MVSFLKKKHAVDALIVAYRNGSMLVSSEEDMDTEALTGTALFNYVRAEIPQSDAILVRAKDWYMLFPFNEKVYILKAGSNLSTIEMHAIAKEMEAFLKKKAVETIEPAEVPPAAAAACFAFLPARKKVWPKSSNFSQKVNVPGYSDRIFPSFLVFKFPSKSSLH